MEKFINNTFFWLCESVLAKEGLFPGIVTVDKPLWKLFYRDDKTEMNEEKYVNNQGSILSLRGIPRTIPIEKKNRSFLEIFQYYRTITL